MKKILNEWHRALLRRIRSKDTGFKLRSPSSTLLIVGFVLLVTTGKLEAQTAADPSPQRAAALQVEDSRDPKTFLKHLLQDQKNIWTSPSRVKPRDAQWLVPLAGITTGLILTDRTAGYETARSFHNVSRSNTAANAGLAAYGGMVGLLYLSGRRGGNPRREETGLLAAEAGINAIAVSEALKYAFRRDRPLEGDGKGHFFRSGGTSFYSLHSSVAFSFATVIASEYPGWLSKALAYGAATGISVARVSGEQHWPSDIFVGGVTGYLIGKSIYKSHHDPAIDGTQYGTFVKTSPTWSVGNAGSTYVPLGDWTYDAVERLRAGGLIRYSFLGLRPWTRTAFAEMVKEAQYRGEDQEVPVDLQAALSKLKEEFAYELGIAANEHNESIQLPVSVYTRSMYISGNALNDSYHFGQNIINDDGRPYEGGYNQVTGFTARATTGRFAFYVNGEFQHAPGRAAYPLSVRQAIAVADDRPLQPAVPLSTVNQFRLLDTYAAVTMLGHEISIGKQSLWWGQNDGGAMIMSNNSEPIYMARINRVVPLNIPLLSRIVGPFRYDGFFGKLSGHTFPPNPFMHGQKISFKPTENLEFGFSRTAVFAGQGLTPLTFRTFWTSFSSTTSSTNPGFDLRRSPGVRHAQFDFSYRVPGLRNWLTIYSDSLVHDDVSPIDAPRRAAIAPGMYLSHFPKLSKLDLRVEAPYTDPSISTSSGGRFMYWEALYKDVYLNKSSLMGSWIGREGKGIQAWSTYQVSPFSKVQLSYRNAKIAKDFIPDGATFNSYAVSAKIRVTPEFEVQSQLQYDRWKVPVLASGLQSNVVSSVQLTYWPKKWKADSSKR